MEGNAFVSAFFDFNLGKMYKNYGLILCLSR